MSGRATASARRSVPAGLITLALAGGATGASVGSGAAIDVTSCSIAELADAASASASCTTTSFTAASATAIVRSAGLHTAMAAGETRMPPR